MHFLIDGHNLIAKMPDIDLADPDDEVRLLMRLRGWAAADKKRRLTIYFDGGMGGKDRRLSSGPVTVIFSSARRTADDLLKRRIQAVKDPGKFRLITNDREIIAVAQARTLAHMGADVFALGLTHERANRQAPPPPSEKEEPTLSEADLAGWLAEFGPVPERKPPPRRRSKAPLPAEPPAPVPLRSADELKEMEGTLNEAELADWLALFGDVPTNESGTGAGSVALPTSSRRRPGVDPRPADTLKASGARLSKDEVDAWLDIFREERAAKKKSE